FFWVILGIEGVLIASEEIKLPSKVIPKGLLLSFFTIIILLLIVSSSYIGFLDRSTIHFPYVRMHELIRFSPPYKMVFGIIQHPIIQMMMLGGIISLSFLAFVSAFFVTSRLIFAMGRDRFFFGSLGKLNPRFHTPSLAVIFLTAIVSIALIAVPEFVTLGLILAAPVLIIFATMALTAAILRKTHAETPRPFSIPCLKCFSIFVFVLATILIFWLGWPWTLGGGGFFLVVLPIYLLVHKRREPIMKSLWLIVYVLGLILLSYLGDPAFVYENFTSIKPLGLITYPSAFFVVGFFGIVIFLWGYYENIKIQKEESLLRDKSSAISDLN
ncbi:MAG TPA: APC family permease, partial [Chlamydiales bacterium]|nr:APC family permease [Chlamydiales bacterium]